MAERSNKSVDIVLENLRQTFRTVDFAITAALTCLAILLAWGLQGDFEREAVQMSHWHNTALVVAPALYLAIQLIAWKFNAGIGRDSA